MSRLAASSAANLANDLSHALDVAETTNAELLQRLEEAEAVIDGVRKVRDQLGHWRCECEDAADQDAEAATEAGAFAAIIALLDGIDGL